MLKPDCHAKDPRETSAAVVSVNFIGKHEACACACPMRVRVKTAEISDSGLSTSEEQTTSHNNYLLQQLNTQ